MKGESYTRIKCFITVLILLLGFKFRKICLACAIYVFIILQQLVTVGITTSAIQVLSFRWFPLHYAILSHHRIAVL